MTDTPPQGPLPDNSTRYGAMQLVAPHMLDDPPVIDALGRHLLLDAARTDKRVLAGEATETMRSPVVFVAGEDGGVPTQYPVEMGSVLDTSGRTEPDAYMLAWEVDTTDRIPDPDPIIGALSDDGVSRAVVDELTRHNGGQVNFRHGIDGEATVRAYNRDGQAMNYLLAVEIERGEHQVEVFPQTFTLTAEPDPDPDADEHTDDEGSDQ